MTSSPLAPESPWRHRGNTAPWRQGAGAFSDVTIYICFSYEAQREGECSLGDHAMFFNVYCTNIVYVQKCLQDFRPQCHTWTKTRGKHLNAISRSLANAFVWLTALIICFSFKPAAVFMWWICHSTLMKHINIFWLYTVLLPCSTPLLWKII